MSDNLKYSRLGGTDADFKAMIQRFGVVTVMNADVYETSEFVLEGNANAWDHKLADEILAQINTKTPIAHLDTLKIANATQEGPTKTVTGGQYSNPLIKFGKSMRLEMQDALGSAQALDALCGTVSEGSAQYESSDFYKNIHGVHVTEDYNGPKTIVGDSFFIHQKTGKQVKVKIIFYQFLPDSIFNLTQDAEGDATVFDMNGDLLTTTILVNDKLNNPQPHGVFYTILDPDASSASTSRTMSFDSSGNVSVTPAKENDETFYFKVDNGEWTTTAPEGVNEGSTVTLRVIEAGLLKEELSATRE